jgi:cytochrome c553
MMRKILIAGAVVFGLAGQGAWAAGDAAAGASKAAPCAACHGADGNSAAPNFPKLAGQSAKYLSKQITDIKTGVRPVPEMMGMVENLSKQDIEDLAAFYASKKGSVNQAKKDLVVKGEQIYRGGIREKGVPACAACHAPDGIGNSPAGFPRLGGQHADYVAKQLKAYRAAADGDATGRVTDGDTKPMRSIAARLSDGEIAALASYISGLH